MSTHSATTTLDDVRLAILRQHTQLEQLLDELELHAMAVVDAPSPEESKGLHAALEILNTRFLRHLEYEDVHLSSWLPQAGRSLLGDHDDQRMRLKGLLHDRDVFGDPRTLAREALAFVHAMRTDMADEESKLRALR